ncbi:hypothetical protein TL5118_01890 [Thalassovita autumnalis]|uniref:DUF4169 domain-containing protein n=1 Tax=Thalassovita autumnalis TaxID=2072972 RepID=A0A0P1FS63_9RHOB|nr:DUF4169 family protein [Thalassovita autumnalis]CUH66757.1 hypothetical protein TL5118_01890 [Thalassovita autumnalis]CUH71496.1 hypothetical protein TL5120_01282 [Thalassovita autumnalis]
MTVVNLNKFRKAKARAEKKAQADENAVRFGRTKVEKSLDRAQNTKAQQDLDGKKRDEQPPK